MFYQITIERINSEQDGGGFKYFDFFCMVSFERIVKISTFLY